jgi:hypothetical protein
MNRTALCILLCAFLGAFSHSGMGATRLPFRSSFETGNFSEWNGGLEASLTVTSQVASEGSFSAQSTMTAGSTTDNYKDFVFGDHVQVRGEPVNSTDGVWLEFDSRFDQGFAFASGAIVHKIAILNFEDENGRRRYQLIINVLVGSNQYFIEHLKWNADRSFNRALPGMSQNMGTPATVRFGQWDRIKMYVRPNALGTSNGIVRLWVNDQLKAEYLNVAIREDSPYNPNKFIMSNYVNSATAAGIQRWDNFYLGVAPPAGSARPRPPVLQDVR